MKNHLAGFGIIMAIGFSIALVGSNPASPLVASLLSTATGEVTQSTATTADTATGTAIDTTTTGTKTEATSTNPATDSTATTTDAISGTGGTSSTATTTDAATGTTPATDQTSNQSAGLKPLISGFNNGDTISGIRQGAVQVFNNPMNVRAEFILPNGEIRPIYPQAETKPISLLTGTASLQNYNFSIDTTSVPDGPGYRVRGFAKYADGSLLSSDHILFAVANTIQEKDFMWVSPEPYIKVKDNLQLQGRSLFATRVTYLIFNAQDTTKPIREGGTEHIGDLWLHRWDTRTAPNGRYYIQPQIVTKSGLTYKANMLGIFVENAQPVVEQTLAVVQSTSTLVEPAAVEQPVATVETKTEPAVEPAQVQPAQQVAPVAPAEPMRVLSPAPVAVEPQQPVVESGTGFFRSVREIFRAVIPKEEPVAPQGPVAVVVTSETVQRLERVANELQESVQGGEGAPQSVVNRIAKDTDGDGIPDYQEVEALHTDPAKKDTDGDGVDDGAEVREGSNPLNSDREAKVQYENAKLLGETVKPELLKIETVALATTTETVVVEVATTTPSGETRTIKESKKVVKEKIKFTGKTLPYALVTIYVYSDIPTIVTVKADKNGSWSYALDKPLDDGDHQAYVTINDSTGKIVAKSQVLGFVKTAQAVTVANFEGLAQAAEGEEVESADESKRTFGIIVALVIGLGLLIGILMVVRSFRNPSSDIV